jgi:hypothetical protein
MELKTMKRAFWPWQKVEGLAGTVAVLCLNLAGASEPLAITEVMSSASTTFGSTTVGRGSDYWELTNFGTNWMDLTGYAFTDVGDLPRVTECFNGLILGPGESAIFIRTNTSARTHSVEEFRQWWGPCLRPEVQVRCYLNPGFDNVEDCVRLLDTNGLVVDRVCFGRARDGVSFVYDTACGDLGAYSVLGVCGACQAANADDIGSPGTTCGRVPLWIAAQPTSLTNLCSGSDAVFSVRACGLPRPKYQWQHNGTSIPGANEATLVVVNPQPADEGQYQVVVTNGLDIVLSNPATLTLDTNLSAPRFLSPLIDVERFVGEKAVFAAQVCAFPPPAFQWYSNGVAIVDATNRTLVLPYVTLPMSGTLYALTNSNALGATNDFARLLVYPTPKLEITEVMPAPDTNGTCTSHLNWFELTNRGSNAVKLNMLQHSDRYSLVGAKAVTDRLQLLPGESAIFVEGMAREAFVAWWGAANLPPGLKVITYFGYGLSPWDDSAYVWSAAAESEIGAFASVSWASPSPPPGPPTCPCFCDPELCDQLLYGRSLFFNPTDGCAWSGRVCKENENGAFRAAQCSDVGSPGFAGYPVILSIRRNGAACELSLRVISGKTYTLEAKDDLWSTSWAGLGNYTASSSTLFVANTPAAGTSQRFYRLRELP